MRVSELMSTALITGNPRDPVNEGLVEMKMAGIRHLLIVDDASKLVGIVSDRDILLSLGTSAERTVLLKDIMTRRVEVVQQSDDAAEALGLMLDKKIGSLPVVGSKGQLVGVVTETDFLQVAHGFLTDRSALRERSRAKEEEVNL